MSAVLIALVDVGPGLQLEEALTQAGAQATWDATQVDGPRDDARHTVVLIDADHLGLRLAAVADAWRAHPSVPGVVAIGSSARAREQAPHARVTLLAPTASVPTLVAAVREAAKLRLASGIRWPVLRAAVNLPPTENAQPAWHLTLVAARNVDAEIPRAALRWHANHYVTATDLLDTLRTERVLSVPELETVKGIDGTLTVQSQVRVGPLDPTASARLLWALASMGALDLTPEIRDVATLPRRALAELRDHLRARAKRLEKSTFYDVLEISTLAEQSEIDLAYKLVAARFAPQMIERFDLAELGSTVQPMWDLVEKARGVLSDHAARGRYHDWLRQNLPTLRTVWAIEPSATFAAREAFARGQKALGDSDVHRAMSELAMACRHAPGHPDYEANLAWARYRVQVGFGRDRAEAATTERKTVERILLGCRPWPRALVALSLLCLSAGDPDAARWHLRIALAVDPNVPAATQLAQRLGMKR